MLSACGGMGTVGWCLKQVVGILQLHVEIEVVEIEWDAAARAMAGILGEGVSRQAQPHDLWEWTRDEKRCREMLRGLGRIDLFVCGFSCQDMSEANRQGKGLQGSKSSVFFAVLFMLRLLRDLNPGMDHLLECTDFQRKHPRDFRFVNEATGTPAVKLDAGVVARCWRKRAFWGSYSMLPLEAPAKPPDPATVLRKGRRLLPRWRRKLPTITTHPGSWNMKKVVIDEAGRQGPLLLQEVKNAMGYGRVPVENATVDGRRVTEKEVWRAMGNAIHASVLCHAMVSWLVTKGYITRDDPRLKGQPWTINYDGPAGWRELKAQLDAKLAAKRGVVRQASALQVVKEDAPRSKQVSGTKRALEIARVEDSAKVKMKNAPTWGEVYKHCNQRGVPQLQVMSRARGDRPKRKPGQEFWQYIDALANDLMILSRAETTWRQYAAWFGVFEEFCDILGCDMSQAQLEDCAGVLLRSLAVLFDVEGYAPKTLELYVTAVSSTLKDKGLGNVRDIPAICKCLEGIKRSMGVSVHKKLPVEGSHIAAWLKMEAPTNDGNAWTGWHSGLQWREFVAVAILAWSCFLRVSEVVKLQVCDLTLQGSWAHPRCMEVLVRFAKADQRGVSTTTVMDAAVQQSPVCLLRTFLRCMVEIHGPLALRRSPQCTRVRFRNRPCACCPYVFPKISVRGVEKQVPTSDRLLRTRMKAAMGRLVPSGLVSQEDVKNFSMISFRRGGNSVAAAMGVRARVRSDHGRWGLAGLVEKGLTCEVDYNSTLARDGGAVMSALNTDVGRHFNKLT